MKAFKKITFKILKAALITLFWLTIWQIISIIIDMPLLLPGPIAVLKRLFELIVTKEFILSSLASLFRIFIGIFIALGLGTLLAVLCSVSKVVYSIFYPVLTIIKATPVVSFVLLIWLFIGEQQTPIIITIMMMLPIVWANVYQGIKSVDEQLLEVCNVYKIPFKKRLTSLYVPSVIPYFVSSLLSGIGLSWKAGVAAEVLCSPEWSIGEAIFNAKYDFDGIELFAWTVTVIILSLIFELLLTRLIKLVFKKYISDKGASNENKKPNKILWR